MIKFQKVETGEGEVIYLPYMGEDVITMLDDLGLAELTRRNARWTSDFTRRGFHMHEGMVRFLPKGKAPVIDDGVITDKGFTSMKAGRALKAICEDLGYSMSDSELEWSSALLSGSVDHRSGIDVLRGKDIIKGYNTKGTSSCMSGKCDAAYLPYTENPEVCGLLVLGDKKEYQARALLWTLPDGKTIMDRTYGTTYGISRLNLFARKEGFIIRNDSKNFSMPPHDNGKSKSQAKTFFIPCNTKLAGYGYVDTFMYFYEKGVSNTCNRGKDAKTIKEWGQFMGTSHSAGGMISFDPEYKPDWSVTGVSDPNQAYTCPNCRERGVVRDALWVINRNRHYCGNCAFIDPRDNQAYQLTDGRVLYNGVIVFRGNNHNVVNVDNANGHALLPDDNVILLEDSYYGASASYFTKTGNFIAEIDGVWYRKDCLERQSDGTYALPGSKKKAAKKAAKLDKEESEQDDGDVKPIDGGNVLNINGQIVQL